MSTAISVILDVDFGDMPPGDVAGAIEEIKKAVTSFGRPHIKVNYQRVCHRFDSETKSRTVNITSKMVGATPIGEAIVATVGSSWDERRI